VPAIVAPLVLAVTLGGCSLSRSDSSVASKLPKGASGAVEELIKSFSSDASGGDADTICSSVLATTLKDRLNKVGGCTHVITKQLNTTSDYTFTIVGGYVHATTAAVRVRTVVSGHHQVQTLDLVKQQHGGWRISSVS
jgi:hypothetical protein